MSVACENCGEDLIGAVNKCWRCGKEASPVARGSVESATSRMPSTFTPSVGTTHAQSDAENPYAAPADPTPTAQRIGADYAGFVRRCIAFHFDVLPITMAVFAFYYFFMGLDGTMSSFFSDPSSGSRIDLYAQRNQIRNLSTIIYLLYCTVAECSPMQGTLGKRLIGIRVTDNLGERLSFWRAFGRNAAKIISQLPLGLGYLWVILSERKRGWHDVIARTLVVKS